jgi:hypothetical protein
VLEKPPDAADQKTAGDWASLVDPKLTRPRYLAALATTLQRTFCTDEGSPYSLAGLIAQLDIGSVESPLSDLQLATDLADAFLDETRCPGARGLPGADKAVLGRIRERVKAPAAGAASR